ncbi:outer membrane protein assembly factor BamB family protein [Calycomorphotria hydatis]|uniref:outer membrane protein assembly factor BamB family protein n=1 Tax=Calycomorphotria hydatis TaxID=2528027 RepID=UPI00119E97E3|nr:PQQ-binding-like beta-propeller repeat protein [Calycomorphotria hydatis]
MIANRDQSEPMVESLTGLISHRPHRIALERARVAMEAGDQFEAIRLLQAVLDHSQDSFILDPQTGKTRGIAGVVAETLSEERISETYLELQGQLADQKFVDAKTTSDTKLLREVVTRFQGTEAGTDSLYRLGAIAYDRGHFESAIRCWESLLAKNSFSVSNSAAEAESHQFKLELRLAIAYQKMGHSLAANQLKQKLRIQISEPNDLPGHLVEACLNLSQSGTEVASDWLQPAGNNNRNHSAPSSIPWMKPRWNTPWVTEKEGSSAFDHWLTSIKRHGVGGITGQTGVMVNGNLYWSQANGDIVCANSKTGTEIWTLHRTFPEHLASFDADSGHREQGDLGELYQVATTSLFGTVSSDRHRLYCVDAAPLANEEEQIVLASASHSHSSRDQKRNVVIAQRLQAIDLHHSLEEGRPVPAWEFALNDLPTASSDQPQNESKVYRGGILSIPLVIADELYLVIERNQELCLLCLDADTGEVRRMQPLCFSQHPLAASAWRAHANCLPSSAAGILVCPTHEKRLIAVDSITGRFLWQYDYSNHDEGYLSEQSNSAIPEPHLTRLLDSPVLTTEHVLSLPIDGDHIDCLELQSGELKWSTPRGDAVYIAGVYEDILCVVGRRRCRGLRIDDGSIAWEQRLGTPAGRGIQLAGRYLHPLLGGRIAMIDMIDGKQIGISHQKPRWDDDIYSNSGQPEFGNLMSSGGTIVAVSPRGVAAFPPARDELSRLLHKERNGSDQDLEIAEVAFALGEYDLVEQRVARMLAHAPKAGDDQQRAKQILSELLYHQLEHWERPTMHVLTELDEMSFGSPQRHRFHQAAVKALLRSGRTDSAVSHLAELVKNDSQRLLPAKHDPGLFRTATTTAVRLSKEIIEQAGPDGEEALAMYYDYMSRGGDVSHAEFTLLKQSTKDLTLLEEVCLKRARAALNSGNIHEAELLLNTLDRRMSSPALRAAKAEVYFRMGFPELAVAEMENLASAETTEREALQFLERLSPADRTAFKNSVRRLNASVEISGASVEPLRWSGTSARLDRLVGSHRRRISLRDCPHVQLLDTGDSREAVLSLIDLQGAVLRSEVKLDPQIRIPVRIRQPLGLHFLPVATPGAVHGISLAGQSRGKPLWSHDVTDESDSDQQPFIGCYGADFCVVQTRDKLIMLSPRDGHVMWERVNHDPDAGLFSDHYVGMLGDGHAITLFGPDRRSYTVYDTQCGEELSNGVLPIDLRRQRRAVGRMLFYVARTPDGLRARLWDPLDNLLLIDRPLDDGKRDGDLYTALTYHSDLFAALLPGRELQIRNAETGHKMWSTTLDAEDLEHIASIRVFDDAKHVYLNLQSTYRPEGTYDSYYLNDTFLPVTHVQGLLLAMDRATGEIMWKRRLPQTSIINQPGWKMPVMIGLARLRNRDDRSLQSLSLDVIDLKTGDSLARSENLIPDRYVQAKINLEDKRIELHGLRSGATIHLQQ